MLVCPYVAGMLRPETQAALETAPSPAIYVELDSADDGAYARLLTRLWTGAGDLVVCEQDVVPSPDQLEAIVDCTHDWCSWPYDQAGYQRVPMLGLAKLSGALRARHPDLPRAALTDSHRHRDPVHWRSVNEALGRHLTHRGEVAVLGDGTVTHLHGSPWPAAARTPGAGGVS